MKNKDLQQQKKIVKLVLQGISPDKMEIIMGCLDLAYLDGKIEAHESVLGKLHKVEEIWDVIPDFLRTYYN
jgi:hypothetical protein